jgi:hypothetical protein
VQTRFIKFLVPKPRLENALAGEAPRLSVTGDGPKPGLRAQMRSQAGAWERGNKIAYKFGFICTFLFPFFSVIKFPAENSKN